MIVSEASRAVCRTSITAGWVDFDELSDRKEIIDQNAQYREDDRERGIQNFTKKEVALDQGKDRLVRDLGGIRDMADLPKAIFVVDSSVKKSRSRKPTVWAFRSSGLSIPTAIRT